MDRQNKTVKRGPRKSAYVVSKKAVENKHIKVNQILPDTWILNSNKLFSQWINDTFKPYNTQQIASFYRVLACHDEPDCPEEQGKLLKLLNQQKFIRDYIGYNSPYRGILVYHGLGSGKTLASIAAADTFRTMNEAHNGKWTYPKIVVMLPASIHKNYLGEIKKWTYPMFHRDQNWRFEQITNSRQVTEHENTYGVPRSAMRDNRGIWIPADEETGVNVNDLTEEQKESLEVQLDATIEKYFQFIHYNGLRENTVERYNAQFFTNKMVVIDEIHNFISMVVGESRICTKIYDAMMEAKNMKIIGLSGTPVINHPVEVGCLLTLMRGKMISYTLKLKEKKKWDNEDIETLLASNSPVIQHFLEINSQEKTVKFTFVPYTFLNEYSESNEYMGVKKSIRDDNITENEVYEKFIEEITGRLEQNGYQVTNIRPQFEIAFPIDRMEFNGLFISKNNLVNQDLFRSRAMGLVSFFRTSGREWYPRVKNNYLIHLGMSDHQFTVYERLRVYERKLEEKAIQSKKTEENDEESVSSFKIFSRLACNFVFPEGLERPQPRDFKGDDGNGERLEKEMVDKIYNGQKNILLADLRSNRYNRYLKLDGSLEQCSPKYHRMLQHVETSPGKVFIYSEFKTMEGIGLFGIVLEENGWCKLNIGKNHDGHWVITNLEEAMTLTSEGKNKKTFIIYSGDEDSEKKDIILNLYNGKVEKLSIELQNQFATLNREGDNKNIYGRVVCGLLATKSAAEGITLSCVRQVHILEPYWNPVRIEQVIGRAVRFESHILLPESERDVDIFMYLATFTEKQLKQNISIHVQDNGLTSDMAVFGILERKDHLNDQILRSLKEVAVDCTINKAHNQTEEETITCYNPPTTTSNVASSRYNFIPSTYEQLKQDFEIKQRKKVNATIVVTNLEGEKETLFYAPNTGYLFRNIGRGKMEKVARMIDGEIRWL